MTFKLFGKKYRFNPPIWLQVVGGTFIGLLFIAEFYFAMVALY